MEFSPSIDLWLDELGLKEGDIALEVVRLESGAVEMRAHLSPRGVEII